MTTDAISGSANRSVLIVHGRDFKPAAETYLDISVAAIRAGLERDYPDCVSAFDDAHKSCAWYGDLNAEHLTTAGKKYDEALDIGDRRNVLSTLRKINARKRFGIRQYDQLPGKSALPEAFANVISPILGGIGLGRPLIRSVCKDFSHYFDVKSEYASKVRARLIEKLCEQLDRGNRVALVTHGTGSVIAYDVLWQLSHDPDYKAVYGAKKVDLWMTLGSPLGDANVQKRLAGAKQKADTRFPSNVLAWHNVSAEDDFTCHDNTLADDFKMMMQKRLVSAVHDYKVFNLAVRYGKSNPHSSVGYYIHPRASKIIAEWLQDVEIQTTPKYTL